MLPLHLCVSRTIPLLKISTVKELVDRTAPKEYVKCYQSGYVSCWPVKARKIEDVSFVPGRLAYSLMVSHNT